MEEQKKNTTEYERKKNSGGPGLLPIVLLICLILPFAVWTQTEDQEISSTESRTLMQKAGILDAAGSGANSLFLAIDEYATDQFPFRSELMQLYTDFQIAIGKRQVRGVMIMKPAAEDGSQAEGEVAAVDDRIGPDHVFEQSYNINDADLWALAKSIDSLKERTALPVIYVLLPQKNLALADASEGQLANDIDRRNLEKIKERFADYDIDVIDCCSYFLETFSPRSRVLMYYKADFHWNDRGAYEAADHICGQLCARGLAGRNERPLNADFLWGDLSDTYRYKGDMVNRLGEGAEVAESIPLYTPLDTASIRYYDKLDGPQVPRESVVASGLSDPEKILEYNTICTFNTAYLRTENSNAKSGLKVLVFKDSYQNAMTDYLSVMFAEMNVIDTRFRDVTADDVLAARDIDLILFMFHQNNVSKDLIEYLDLR